jgi:hypothetical protein
MTAEWIDIPLPWDYMSDRRLDGPAAGIAAQAVTDGSECNVTR